MADLIRVLPKREVRDPEADPHLREEWLVTNGLGGYASGTVSGAITRRYHGLLIAALPNPLGRMMMLNGLSERLRLPDRRVVYTGAEELAGITPENTLPAGGVPPGGRAAGVALRVWTASSLEKRLLHAVPAEHRPHHLPACWPETASCGWGCGRRSTSARTMLRSAPTDPAKYMLTVCDDQFEITSTRRTADAAAC